MAKHNNFRFKKITAPQPATALKGNELPLAPQHQFNLQTNYRVGSWNWNFTGLHRRSAFSDGVNTVDENADGLVGKIPSYSVWNAQVTHDFVWNGARMKETLAVNNLFDRDNYFRGVDFSQGRMPAPGRAALVSLQMGI